MPRESKAPLNLGELIALFSLLATTFALGVMLGLALAAGS